MWKADQVEKEKAVLDLGFMRPHKDSEPCGQKPQFLSSYWPPEQKTNQRTSYRRFLSSNGHLGLTAAESLKVHFFAAGSSIPSLNFGEGHRHEVKSMVRL